MSGWPPPHQKQPTSATPPSEFIFEFDTGDVLTMTITPSFVNNQPGSGNHQVTMETTHGTTEAGQSTTTSLYNTTPSEPSPSSYEISASTYQTNGHYSLTYFGLTLEAVLSVNWKPDYGIYFNALIGAFYSSDEKHKTTLTNGFNVRKHSTLDSGLTLSIKDSGGSQIVEWSIKQVDGTTQSGSAPISNGKAIFSDKEFSGIVSKTGPYYVFNGTAVLASDVTIKANTVFACDLIDLAPFG